ncbi:hypothetical protein BC943DRAFT_360349 [Umbelopsis sp. AD052]|nr:hypothetical protein BC943DRAFT_360349 [Umbelopsis sp. AD052]
MSTKPISFISTDNKPSSTPQHVTFGPFSAPELLPAYSPPTARQLNLTSPPTSPGGNWRQGNLPIQFSRRASLPPPPNFSILSQHLKKAPSMDNLSHSEPSLRPPQKKDPPVNKIISKVQKSQKRPYSPMGNAILEGQFLD